MTYQLKYYNSLDRSWRDGKKFTSKPKARLFAIDYFDSIKRDGIFGEPDKLYLVGTLKSWVFNKATKQWKETK